jgi:hypothetical protein
VRFERLVGGRYFARFVADGTTWLLGEVEVAPGGMAERAWTLGANTIRGRVVAGPDRRPVADAEVYAIGAAWASTKSGPDGRFAFSGARTGRYAMSARRDAAGARVAGFAVPDDAEIVLELAPHGRLVVRFSKEDRAALLTADVNLFTSDGENAGSLADGEGDDDLVSGGLVPGRYEVEVAALGRTRRFAAEIRADATTVVIVTSP